MNKKSFLKTLTLGLILAVLAGSALSAFSFQTAKAATTITVNSTLDQNGNDGLCTLREAIIAANTDKASGNKAKECPAGSGDDVIQLEPKTYTLTRTDNGNEDSSQTGDLDIKSNVTIMVPPGVGQATIQGQALNFHDRVIQVLSGKVYINNINITGGNLPSGNGGGIGNWGNLELNNSFIYGNKTPAQGGGLYNAPGPAVFLKVTGSTIGGDGSTTFPFNTATGDGGGLSNDGTATLTNTTVSGNNSNGSGGGIVNRGTLTLNAVTVTANKTNTSSGNGGGVKTVSGTFNIWDTLIGGNSSAATPKYADCATTLNYPLNSNGYNLIQSIQGCTISGVPTGNLTGVDPKLGPLASNGGPTLTHALLASSPAIDAGVCKDTAGNTITVDQRGNTVTTRPQGPACDIGAYEQVFVPAPGLSLLKQVSPNGTNSWDVSITVAGGSPVYYRFTINNTGNVPLSSISVNDPNMSTSSCAFTNPLPAGSTTTCVVGPVTAPKTPGTIPNTATASGVYGGNPVSSTPSSASYIVPPAPSLSLDQKINTSNSGFSSSSINVSGNSPVYYQFTVTNTGNVVLSSIGISNSDPKVNTSSCMFSNPLAIGATTSCVVGPVTAAPALGTYTNTATASGGYSGQTITSSSSSANYIVNDPVQTGPVYTITAVINVTNPGTCTDKNCSLQDAVLAANVKANGSSPDEIHFNLPVTGPLTIAEPLPAITDPVIIDGYTQPGASQNTLPVGSNAVLKIVLDGTIPGANPSGLTIQASASNSKVCGLIIQKFSGDGITINGSNVTVCGNQITHNGGAGVRVPPGSGDTITANVISANTVGGIVLSSGPNPNQVPPTLTVSSERVADATPSTDVGGVLSPNTTYRIELFNSTTCSGAQGDAILTSTTLTTDANGNFLVNVNGALALGAGVTSTATGADGSTSTFSTCAATQALNDSWLMAQPLSFVASGVQSSDPVKQNIYQTGQTRWFKFPVLPGANVQVTVKSLPGTMVTLHRDLFKIYNQLIAPTNASALSANDLSGGYLPGSYLPGSYLPGSYLPGSYLPGSYLPGGVLPGSYLPGSYLPGSYLPGSYLPGSYLPGSYLPGSYLPGSYLPGNPLPDGYLPELYSGAIRRGLIAIANDQVATTQTIERNTWDLSEDLYVMVSGPTSLAGSDAFSLKVTVTNGVCASVSQLPDPSASSPVIAAGSEPASGALTTLILWDSKRMLDGSPQLPGSPQADVDTLRNKLATFAARTEVNGAVIDLASPTYPRVQQANNNADTNTACITAKNAAAVEIKRVIDAYRATNTPGALQYIVLVGGDREIPFFRYPDQAGLANENVYVPPVAITSASEASLRNGQVLGQDAYGAQTDVTRSGFTIPVPQQAVGRLVRTAAEVSGMLDAYTAANGMVTPGLALVTGYDFVADAATNVQKEFYQGLNPANCSSQPGGCLNVDSLIQPQTNGLTGAWTANDLRNKLLPASGKGSNLIFLAGHFSAGSVLAGDYTTSMYSTELLNSSVDYTNSLIFALGCHSGYNIPGVDALSYSPVPDWTEVFATKKATFVAATGYAYGDTDLTGYGEQLFLKLSQQLRTGNGPVAIGQALVNSKREYMAQHPTLEGIDDKTILETTLYGLPMLKVNMPGQRITNSSQTPIVGSVSLVPGGPGASLGLQIGQPVSGGTPGQIEVNPNPMRQDVPLNNSTVTATYFSGTNLDLLTRPAEPIFPLDLFNVGVNGFTLRGVGFRGGRYLDVLNITPLTSAATTENSRGHPSFFSDFFYPLQNWAGNYFGAIDNGTEQLIVTPAQYRSNSLSSASGTFRKYSNMAFRLYYLDKSWPTKPNCGAISCTVLKAAAVAAAPYIHDITVQQYTGNDNLQHLHFQAIVESDPAAKVQDVWVTYTSKNGAWYGSWQSLDLSQKNTQNPKLWEEDLPRQGDPPLPQGVSLSDLSYFVQAANGAGSVSLVDPSLKSTGAVPLPVVNKQTTQIQLNPTDATSHSGDSGLVTATLQDELNQPIRERTVVFVVRDTSNAVVYTQTAITNYLGQASLGKLNLAPGDYSLTVYFLIDPTTGQPVDQSFDDYFGSTATGAIHLINHAPDCSLAVPDIGIWIWPPNNTFYPVTIQGVTDIDGDHITIVIDAVYQDEAVGTGNSAPDATGIGTNTVKLRAERDGSGDGRVYHIFFTASDGKGGTCRVDMTSTIKVRVGVSDNQGGGIDPIDGGARYDSTKPTP